MNSDELPFYGRWILANGWAEAAGLGTTFVLGQQVAPAVERLSAPFAIVAAAVGAVLLGALLEGGVVGWAQGSVLGRRLDALRRRTWVVATAAGAALAWTLGMVPSTVMALGSAPDAGGAPPAEPGAVVRYALAVALGAVTGPVLGVAQWVVLRRHAAGAARWLAANAAAWAVGMPLIFLGMDLVPWAGGAIAIAVSLYAVCGLVGVVVGAIHGLVLVRILRP